MNPEPRPASARDRILENYTRERGFHIFTAAELEGIYRALEIDPKSSHRLIFETEGLSHHHQAEMLRLFEAAEISARDLVLDAGCGNGGPTRLLAKLKGCRIRAFDLNEVQIARAAECNRLEGVEALIELSVQDVHRLNYPDAMFDRVIHNETSCHWERKGEAFAELRRVLKPGGLMAFHDWSRGDAGGLDDAGGDFPGTYAPGIWFQTAPTETAALLRGAGFEVILSEDTTDAVDAGMRARLKELELSSSCLAWFPEKYYRLSLRYFRTMIATHYTHLRYRRFLVKRQ